MRTALGIAMLSTAGFLTGAAQAQPSDLFGDAAAPVLAQTSSSDVRIARDFRVRTDLVTVGQQALLVGPDATLRHRFASSMIDYYPLGGATGLRVSGGLRLYENAYFFRDAEKQTGGLLWAPQFRGGGNVLRGGYARYTPAATIGYTATVRHAVVGVEVGSLLGTANSMPQRDYGLSNARRSGMNPVAKVMLDLRF